MNKPDSQKDTVNHPFQASVGKLLDIVAHALYSEREVFMRELISNAADACDRLRFRAIEKPELLSADHSFKITLSVDSDQKILEISDNGEGMTATQMVENLGTIARSGTEAFLNNMNDADRKSSSLIGQFGVGFYSSFMVAENVEVISRPAGSDEAQSWKSDGRESYSISPATRDTSGTTIRIKLKQDAEEFLEKQRIEHIVKTYSNHISIPVLFLNPPKVAEEKVDDESKDDTNTDSVVEGDVTAEIEPLNQATALWRQNKSDVSKEDYTEFYRHHSHAFDEPFHTIHAHIEGVLEYTALLFLPTDRPFDLFDPERQSKLKLYVKRVFITDQCAELMPNWLRFVRGVVDSQDLPLNVSRELLQNSPVLSKMKKELTRRVLNALKDQSNKNPEGYNTFFENFGAVLKEGLYEEFDQQDNLLPLCRFLSSQKDTLISLDDYVSAMPEDQKAIYYISGDSIEAIKASPQLEGFSKRGINVLCLIDPVDEFWLPRVPEYKELKIQSITRGDIDLDDAPSTSEESQKDKDTSTDPLIEALLERIKTVLGDDVSEVKKSHRLDSSPACFVASENGMDKQLEKLLRAHNRLEAETPKVFEINPTHPIILGLAAHAEADADQIWLLYDQTRIVEGQMPKDAKAFSQRLSAMMQNNNAKN